MDLKRELECGSADANWADFLIAPRRQELLLKWTSELNLNDQIEDRPVRVLDDVEGIGDSQGRKLHLDPTSRGLRVDAIDSLYKTWLIAELVPFADSLQTVLSRMSGCDVLVAVTARGLAAS